MRRNIYRTTSCFIFISLSMICASRSHAQVTIITEYNDAVRAGSGPTYFDLIRKIFPDAEMNTNSGVATAHKSIPLNQLNGDYKATVYKQPMKIISVETLGTLTMYERRVIVLIHVGSDTGGLSAWNQLSILARFELEPSVKLLDSVDVQADKFSEFWEQTPVIQIEANTDAVIISNNHYNSSQNYHSLTIVAPVNDRLRNLFELPVILSSNDCGNNITQAAKLSAIKGKGPGYFNINVNVSSIKHEDDASCEKRTKGYAKNYKATLIWNRSKRQYMATGVGMNQLARFNKNRS